jgi:hypothetical protein
MLRGRLFLVFSKTENSSVRSSLEGLTLEDPVYAQPWKDPVHRQPCGSHLLLFLCSSSFS